MPNNTNPATAASKATGRADAVPSLDSVLRERGLPTVADALSYSRNYAEATPHLTKTGKDHILSLCTMLEMAAQHRPAEPAARELVAVGDGLAYGITDPDYALIFTIAREIAWAEGYALAMHGSFTRDLDLIAVPWADRVCDPEHLVNRIVDAAGLRNKSHSNPGVKPHGRLAWTLHLPEFGDSRWVDLSVVQNAHPSPHTLGREMLRC